MGKKSTEEANIELNQEMNGEKTSLGNQTSTEEANMKLNRHFNADHHPEEITPTYLYNNTPAIKVTKEKQ